MADKYVPRLMKKYKEEIVPALLKKLGCKNVMQVPKLDRIVINMGVGEATQNSKIIDAAVKDLKLITGQQPVVTKAKKSEAGFKLREGVAIGVKVTLRKEKMYEFLDRFINLSLPRVKDFEGVSDKSFDGRGNYSIGIKEQLIFPEIEYDKIEKILGMSITIVTSAETDEACKALLTEFGMPFKK